MHGYLLSVQTKNVVFGTTAIPTYYPSGYSNRQLGWGEKQTNGLRV